MSIATTRRAEEAFRDARREEAAALLRSDAARTAIALHGTPVLLLETERVRAQYRRLRAALPFVDFHFAVKALAHEGVLEALAEEGCGFDVATGEELALLDRVPRNRIIHTHPIKKAAEIAEAVEAGVRTFVIDNEIELAKFADAPADVRLLVRLAYRSPHAKSDLSSKFGVGASEAMRLIVTARACGIRVAGFSFHVGSQLDDPARFAAAITETIALIDRVREELGVRLDVLDIGGGFPVAYDSAVRPLEELAAVIAPVLAPHSGDLEILAEPGRAMVAESMMLVTSVVGVAEREDGRWYYLDDGLYGAYSNVLTEDVHPLIFAERELGAADTSARRSATLAGPTCDSSDVIAREALMPDLEVGDLLVSPAMGAYTVVTASRFNGRPVTTIAVLDAAEVSPLESARAAEREPALA